MVKKLMPKIASYPNGTEVILSTGEKGIVNLTNAEPILKVEIAKKENLLYGSEEKILRKKLRLDINE